MFVGRPYNLQCLLVGKAAAELFCLGRRYPITSVSVTIGGSYLPLKRTNNNQWAYYNTNGPWQSNFPMGIKVTNCLGETVTVSLPSTSRTMLLEGRVCDGHWHDQF